MTDWPIVVHISAPNTTEERERTHHDEASSYKELCEGRATELYKLLLITTKKNYFPHFQEHFYNSVRVSFFMLLCYVLQCTVKNRV